jgi:cytochrome c-type biogenesis protein CcmH/NrfF
MTREIKQHIAGEFQRGPVSFILNILQVGLLLSVLLGAAVSFGIFKEQWKTLQSTVATISKDMKFGFEAAAAEDKRLDIKNELRCMKIENAVIDHTGKPIR